MSLIRSYDGQANMWASLAKFIGGKVLTAILIVASLACAYWIYQHPEDLRAWWAVLKRVLTWIGFVLALPWFLFFVPAWVLKFESNVAAAVMLAGYLVLDIAAALFLADWHVSGTLTWTVLVLGFLCAGVYNFLVCDYQAHRLEESL